MAKRGTADDDDRDEPDGDGGLPWSRVDQRR
jgi:hypothetical protein